MYYLSTCGCPAGRTKCPRGQWRSQTKVAGGQIFWLQASNSFLLGIPAFKAQNIKIC